MCKNTGIRLSVLELSKGAVLYVSFHSWPLNKVRFQRLGEGYKSPLFYEHGAGKFPFLKMSPEKKIHIHIQFHARSIVQIENLEEVLVQGAGVCYWLVLNVRKLRARREVGSKSYKRSRLLPWWKSRVSKGKVFQTRNFHFRQNIPSFVPGFPLGPFPFHPFSVLKHLKLFLINTKERWSRSSPPF